MFSRYKKPQMDKAKPVGGVPGGAPGAAPVVAKSELTGTAAPKPDPEPVMQTTKVEATPAEAKPTVKSRPVTKTVGETATDKKLKQRQRLEELKTEMHHRLLDNLNPAALEGANPSDLQAELVAICSDELSEMGVVLNTEDRQTLHKELFDEITGLGPLEPLLRDEDVNDILVNGFYNIYVERADKLSKSEIRFKDEAHFLRIIDKIVSAVGRRVDESPP